MTVVFVFPDKTLTTQGPDLALLGSVFVVQKKHPKPFESGVPLLAVYWRTKWGTN